MRVSCLWLSHWPSAADMSNVNCARTSSYLLRTCTICQCLMFLIQYTDMFNYVKHGK